MGNERRPLGINIIGAVFTLIGGFWFMITLIQIFDSIRLYGLHSVVINSFPASLGFFLYGLTPLLFYSTGMNLFMSRPWARASAAFLIPGMSLVLVMNLALKTARVRSSFYISDPLSLIVAESDVFLRFLLQYLVVFVPLIAYLNHPRVVRHFKKGTASY